VNVKEKRKEASFFLVVGSDEGWKKSLRYQPPRQLNAPNIFPIISFERRDFFRQEKKSMKFGG